MIIRKIVFVAFITLLLPSCSPENNKAISKVELDDETVNVFQLKYVRDSILVKLSDIAEDLHFIKIETNPKCLLKNPRFFVGEKYIIAFDDQRSIFQFDRNGKFIRTITTHGQGPYEVKNYIWAVDEKNNMLYLKNLYENYFLSYDLNQGVFLKDIPLAVHENIAQFVVPNKDIFLVAPTISETSKNPNFAFWQNSKGDFISGIHATDNVNVNYRRQIMFENSEGIYYYNSKSDTLYYINNHKWSPKWIFNLGENNPKDPEASGNKSLNIISYQKNFVLSSLFIAEETKKFNNVMATEGKLFYLFMDRIHQTAHYIKKLNVDIINQPIRPVLINTQANKTVFIKYYALNLKEQIEKTIQNNSVSKEQIDELKELNKTINSEDNPLLLVGRIRS